MEKNEFPDPLTPDGLLKHPDFEHLNLEIATELLELLRKLAAIQYEHYTTLKREGRLDAYLQEMRSRAEATISKTESHGIDFTSLNIRPGTNEKRGQICPRFCP